MLFRGSDFEVYLASLLSLKPSGCVKCEWSCLGTKVREKSGIGLALKLEVLELRSSCDAEGVTLLPQNRVRTQHITLQDPKLGSVHALA